MSVRRSEFPSSGRKILENWESQVLENSSFSVWQWECDSFHQHFWQLHHFKWLSQYIYRFERSALEFDWVTSLILRSVTVFFQNSFSAHINDQNFLLVRLSTFASNTSVPFPVSLMELLTKSKSWNRSEFREI